MKFALTPLKAAVAAAVTFSAAPALAEGFEALVIANRSDNGSEYYYLSLRSALAFAGPGVELRFDAAAGSYDTDFDATPGTGRVRDFRLILSYDAFNDGQTTVTLNGGVSHRSVEVRPVTGSSPADSSDTGGFVSVELANETETGDLFAVAEHNSVAGNYLAASYLFHIGSLSLGPTANYIVDGDYSRRAYGLSAVYEFSENFEAKLTGASAEQTIDGFGSTDADYFELQLFTKF